MENERELFDEIYEEALADLGELTPGSEEYERQAKAISNMLKARAEQMKAGAEQMKAEAEQMKAEADVKNKKGQIYTDIAQVAIGALTAGVTLIGILMQRKTNKDVMSFEEEDVITSKAFDNKRNFR